MALYPFLYVCIIPFLIIFLIVRKEYYLNQWVHSLLPVFNWMLLVYAVYQLRVIVGIIQLIRAISASAPRVFQWQDYLDANMVRLLASVFLPLLFLFSTFNKSKWFSLAIMLLYLNIVEWPVYSTWEWFKNIAIILSWFAVIAGGRWFCIQPTKNNQCIVQSK